MLTREEARAIYRAGEEVVVRVLLEMSAKIDEFQKRMEELQDKVEILEKTIARLTKNSSNSSKPPSSDDITKPKTKNKNGKKRRIGAQPGHPRNERSPFPEEEIDKFHDYKLASCPDCNGEVTLLDKEPRIIQQVEVNEVIVTKEEHRSYPVWCENCQKIHYMNFPPEVMKEGLFKERLTALIAYMKYVDHASFSTIRKFIRDILRIKNVSRGYLRKVIQKVSDSLEKPYQELFERLPLEKKVNVDETGHKENGDKFWTWVFKADLYVLFKIDKSRGSKVLIDVLGKEFNGVLGCDYFSSYRKYMRSFNIIVQFCLAHLIRDIRFLISFPDKETRIYGEKLLKSVKKLFKVIHEREEMTEQAFKDALIKAKAKIMAVAIEDAPSSLNKNGKEKKKEAQNMARRFRIHGKAYFEFITTPGIEPTNNIAEQAVRFVVIDRMITQGTRSIKGRQTSERLWTVIATCRLQGRSAYDFILKAVNAYFHKRNAPSLLPGFT